MSLSLPIKSLPKLTEQCPKLRSRSLARTRSRSRCRSCSQSRGGISRSKSRGGSSQPRCKIEKWNLVARKSKYINICWKYSMITLMVFLAALHFLTTYGINSLIAYQTSTTICSEGKQLTIWHIDSFCEYLIYVPLCMALVAMFWVEMFYLCGRGGFTHLHQHIDDNPWRIVLPAVVCFAVMSILQLVYFILLHVHMTKYCNNLRNGSLKYEEKSCENLIAMKSTRPDAWHYRIVYYSVTLSLVLWFSATTIMTMRVLRAPDFKVVVEKPSKVKTFSPMPQDIEDSSKEKLIFMNREFAMNRSVHFNRLSV